MTTNPRITIYGDKMWYWNQQRHRLDGPAEEYVNGDRVWCINGQRHRLDGPAVVFYDKRKIDLWYIDGVRMRNRKEFQLATGISDEEMIMLILKYGDII